MARRHSHISCRLLCAMMLKPYPKTSLWLSNLCYFISNYLNIRLRLDVVGFLFSIIIITVLVAVQISKRIPAFFIKTLFKMRSYEYFEQTLVLARNVRLLLFNVSCVLTVN